jgi:spoIIIJ-associated protein
MSSDLNVRVTGFVAEVLAAMGLTLDVAIQETPDNVRVELSGEGAELLIRRKGEALEALQHVVNTTFRREVRDGRPFVIDSLDYRKSKDLELRQMAQFLMEKAKATGAPQEMGPLNPYARRLVHLTVAEDSGVTSESIGDAFLKTVIISPRTS